MLGYEFYWRDPIKGYQLVGVLPERRRNPKRITEESILNWGKKCFGNDLDLNEMLFFEVEIDGVRSFITPEEIHIRKKEAIRELWL